MRRTRDYSVKLTGRAGIIYEEGPKKMLIDSELLSGPTFDVVVFLDSIRAWEPPFDAEPLSAADITRIKANVAESLNHMRVDWQ